MTVVTAHEESKKKENWYKRERERERKKNSKRNKNNDQL